MKNVVIILLFALLISGCSSEQNREEKQILLSGTNWTVPADPDRKLDGVWAFSADGTYEENFDQPNNKDRIVLKGKWEWISDTELTIQYIQMKINGKNYDLEPASEDKRVLRIVELSKEKLIVVSRHILDAEDSGFASTVTYLAVQN